MQSDEYRDMSNKGQLHISTGCFPCGCLRAVWPGERGVPRAACVFQLAGSPACGRGRAAGDTWPGTRGQPGLPTPCALLLPGWAAFPGQGDGMP